MEALEEVAEEDRRLDSLGADIIRALLSRLDARSLAHCACVNSTLMHIVYEDAALWRSRFMVRQKISTEQQPARINRPHPYN